MADNQNGRVAVYLDFDNIVLSWYDRVHGRNSFGRDRQRIAEDPTDPEIAARLEAAAVDVGAIIDYASSFGTLVLTRAYADWSLPVNALYRSQLVARAVDLVQLFPAAAYAKNGADIRLAVDTVEDMFRLDDLTHVVIVAGDSDYVPLAQRCKRLGRYVVGIGVAGSTAKALTAACDEFASYDTLPGIERPGREEQPARGGRGRGRGRGGSSGTTADAGAAAETTDVVASGAEAAELAEGASNTSDTAGTAGTSGAAGAAKETGAKSTGAKSSSGRGATKSGRGRNAGTKGQRGASESADASVPDNEAAAADATDAEAAERVEAVEVVEAPQSNSRSRSRRSTRPAAAAGSAQADSEPAQQPPRRNRLDNVFIDDFDEIDFDGDGDFDGDFDADSDDHSDDSEIEITGLLIRALWLGQEKDDSEWLHSSAVKQQMRRMDPSFNEKALGFRSFSEFLKSRSDIAELEETGHERLVRLRDQSE